MIRYKKLRLVSLIVFLLLLFIACGRSVNEPFYETLQMQDSFFELVNDPEARAPWLVGATALGFGLLLLFILFQKKRYEGRKLEALVQERTVELNRYQRELEDALEDARAANASKSVFLANMSHEIRTPMNSIMGFSELALDDEVSPKTRDYLAKIRTNTEWLLQIINDILDISKVESGKMELEHIPFDMHELFIACRTLIMPKAIEKGIMLYFYVEPSIGKMPLGDPTRLRQVLTNLLSNAVKFTNTGMIKLHAAIKEMKEKTVSMHFEVRDSGIGMTAEQIEKIFIPFAQADSGTTRQYGGTGLGLSITKNFIELMGGKLSVESTPGVGSRFSFDLTFDTVEISADEMLDKRIMLEELERPSFEGEVLLCEDNVMNQQVICEHLARVGLKTAVAENGKIGVDMVLSRKEKGKNQFDLIFMDMHMPVMDGIEAATRIISLDTNVPIVAMTANMMTDELEVYKMSGIKDCVGKPFTSQELWRCLLKYLIPLSRETVPKGVEIEEDTEFQKELRELFVRNNRTQYAEIANALEAGDISLAHRLAHTLKSNAGQLGEDSLRQIAWKIESILKNGKNQVTSAQMAALETELNATLSRLAPPPGSPDESLTSAVETPVLDVEKIKELINRLEPMLKGGIAESLDFVNDLRAIPGSGPLIRQIKEFDFEAAYSTLTELKKGWF
jgi:signal transduction histidine kinase/DNA-binding response OmpR family regulator